jgi:hypothetical protein
VTIQNRYVPWRDEKRYDRTLFTGADVGESGIINFLNKRKEKFFPFSGTGRVLQKKVLGPA